MGNSLYPLPPYPPEFFSIGIYAYAIKESGQKQENVMKCFPQQLALDSLVIFTGIVFGLVSFNAFSQWISTPAEFATSAQHSIVATHR
ncbi:MAG: hypothetical protein AAGF01_23200 [Cyanobacteria bacterium P01_G01_bin.38]